MNTLQDVSDYILKTYGIELSYADVDTYSVFAESGRGDLDPIFDLITLDRGPYEGYLGSKSFDLLAWDDEYKEYDIDNGHLPEDSDRLKAAIDFLIQHGRTKN